MEALHQLWDTLAQQVMKAGTDCTQGSGRLDRCSFTPCLLRFSPIWLFSVSLKQTANWPYLSSSCFSPVDSRMQYELTSLCCNCLSSVTPVYLPVHSLLCAATVSALLLLSAYLFTHFSVLQLPQLCCSCLLTCSLTSLCCNCLSSIAPVCLPVHSLLCATTASALLLLSAYLFTPLCCNCLSSIVPVNLTKLLKVYKPTHQLCSFYDTSILSSLCVHTLTWLEIFFLCSTVCLEQSPFQSLVIKHTHIFQTIFEISPLQAVLLTVCVYALCFGSSLCNGLCVPIRSNST